jgi:histidyl-tRNA synthetase
MNDILPDEMVRWHRLEAAFRHHAQLHGYAEVRTPLLEHTALFTRSIGETTDVVEKEMYSFERHGDALTVRPEGTASAARAYVEHQMHAKEPVSRWYYLGPMFRGERPAKGRYRQFYQAGCELYGDPGPLCDAEMIELISGFLKAIGIPDFKVHINTLGSGGTRERYREALLAHFTPLRETLSEDSQRRLEKNPLRVLDSKSPADREASKGAPALIDFIDDADREHWSGLLAALDALGVDYVIDPSLVRGLDYYTRTLFEIRATASDLGSQNTLCGGGRYDTMIESLGGQKVPAIGFAMGMERLLATMPEGPKKAGPDVYLVPLTPKGAARALLLGRELRGRDVVTELDGRGGKLKAMMSRAEKRGARFCVLLGDEIDRGVVSLKNLAARTQEELPIDAAGQSIADRVKSQREADLAAGLSAEGAR